MGRHLLVSLQFARFAQDLKSCIMGVKCCLIASLVVVLSLCATADLPSDGSAVLDVDLFGQQRNIADIADLRQKREAIPDPKRESGKNGGASKGKGYRESGKHGRVRKSSKSKGQRESGKNYGTKTKSGKNADRKSSKSKGQRESGKNYGTKTKSGKNADKTKSGNTGVKRKSGKNEAEGKSGKKGAKIKTGKNGANRKSNKNGVKPKLGKRVAKRKSNKNGDKRKSDKNVDKKKSGNNGAKVKSGKNEAEGKSSKNGAKGKSGTYGDKRKSGKDGKKRKSGNNGGTKKPGKKGAKRKSSKKRQSTTATVNLTCLRDAITFTKFLKDNVINFLRRNTRLARLNGVTNKKASKKGEYKEPAARLIQAGGGDKTNLSCSGSTTSVGAKKLKTVTDILDACEIGIKNACKPPSSNTTTLNTCKTNAIDFNVTVSKCIKLATQGKDACSWFQKASVLKEKKILEKCKGSTEAKAAAAARKACVEVVQNCKNNSTAAATLQYACSYTTEHLLKTLKQLTANLAAFKGLLDKIKELTGILVGPGTTNSTLRRVRSDEESEEEAARLRGKRQEQACSTITTII